MLKYGTLFKIVHPIVNLALQVWIILILMNVLVLKDCLSIFLWIGLKLEEFVNFTIMTLCTNGSLLWATFFYKVYKNFSESDFEQGCKDSLSLTKTSTSQAQMNELLVERKNEGNYACQNCQNISERLCFKNLLRTSLNHSPTIEVIKHNVGTQTLIKYNSVKADSSNLQSPTNTYVPIFGEELDSSETGDDHLKSNCIKKRIALGCGFSPVTCSSPSHECKRDSNSRILTSEFEKCESSSINQNDSPTTSKSIAQEFIDIPLESPQFVSQLLESPLCQINLESMENLRLTFSEDVCVPRLSPEGKSIFKKSLDKLKLMCKVNGRLLEIRNLKRKHPDGISAISEQPFAGAKCNIIRQQEVKNLTAGVEDSEMIGCCSYMFHRLKSKFDQKSNKGSVVYKKF